MLLMCGFCIAPVMYVANDLHFQLSVSRSILRRTETRLQDITATCGAAKKESDDQQQVGGVDAAPRLRPHRLYKPAGRMRRHRTLQLRERAKSVANNLLEMKSNENDVKRTLIITSAELSTVRKNSTNQIRALRRSLQVCGAERRGT